MKNLKLSYIHIYISLKPVDVYITFSHISLFLGGRYTCGNSKHNLQDLDIFFHRVGPGDQIQVIRG